MECFQKLVDGMELLNMFAKRSILDPLQGSKYDSAALHLCLGKKLM